MNINMKNFNDYEPKNKERIVNFLNVVVNLLEIEQASLLLNKSIPASILNQKYGFGVSELDFFVRATNELLGELELLRHESNTIYISNKEFERLSKIEKMDSATLRENQEKMKKAIGEDSEKYTYLEFNFDSLSKLKSLLKEFIKKGYGKKEEKTIEKSKKYFDIKEDIELKTLGIKIEGNFMVCKKEKSKKINSTDKQLINFLYLRFVEDQQLCFKKKVLAEELGTSEGNIQNRISFINQEIRKIITKGKTSIDNFIKNEARRGYHLNPRFMIQFTKKK